MDISIGKDVIFLKGQAPTDYIDLNKGVTTEVMKNKTRLKKGNSRSDHIYFYSTDKFIGLDELRVSESGFCTSSSVAKYIFNMPRGLLIYSSS